MKQSVQHALTVFASASALLFAGSTPVLACGTESAIITNLPPVASGGYQVYGLSARGQVAGFLSVSGVHGPHAFLYADGGLTDLGTLGGLTSIGYAVNGQGQVAGQADLAGSGQGHHAFLFSNGSMVDLGTLGGRSSSAAAVNEAGQVVGESDPAVGVGPVAFSYANGAMISLGTLGGTYSSAFAINDPGQIAGESSLANGDIHGFAWANGALNDLGTLGGDYSSAFAINPNGVIVGESAIASGDVHAFVYTSGAMVDLGTLGGTYSSAFAVNTNGQVVGNATLLNDQVSHGFFYTQGSITDIGTLGGGNSSVWGLNNLGQVVGNSQTSIGSTRAFLWQTNQMTDLNTLLPANSGWVLMSAQFINDAGRIVGYGTLNGTSQWFVMDLAKGGNPPVAIAGPDQIVNCQATALLDGSASHGAANEQLTFEWSLAGGVLGTDATLSLSLPLGTNVITLKVTDSCGGSAQTNVVVTVLDTTPPSGSCPNAVTASSDVNCQARIPNVVAQVVASDNCTPQGELTITQDPLAGTLVNSGLHQITLTVSDPSGNRSTCTVPFTVSDTMAPSFIRSPGMVAITADGNCQGLVPDVRSEIVVTDNCTPANQVALVQSPAAGSPVTSGLYTILVVATDGSGNSSSTNVMLQVLDKTAPVFVSVPQAVTVSALTACQAPVPNVISNVLATDNCTPANLIVLTQTPAAGTPLGIGAYSILVTAVDASGNASVTNVPLTVIDSTAPRFQAVPPATTVWTGPNCQGAIPNLLAGVVVLDNCTPADQLLLTQTPSAGTMLSPGHYLIAIETSDLAGNHASTNVSVTIVNTNAPAFQSVTATPNVLQPPNHQLVPVTISAIALDGCGAFVSAQIISITSNEPVWTGDIQVTGNLSALLAASRNPSGGGRVYTITVQASDKSGNTATALVTVSVPQGNGSGSISPAVVHNK